MNLQQSAKARADDVTAEQLATRKFAVGQSVPRAEDPLILRGNGRYTDDISLPGQAYLTMVRSSVAHGKIRSIDIAAAAKMPGVLGVYTSAELKGYGPLKCVVALNNRDGTPLRKPRREALAIEKVRHVGDPVACVVAETLLQAKDAAEAVTVDIEPLPIVTSPEAGARDGAPPIYDDVPNNIALDFHYGDTAAVDAAFATAAHVTRLKLVNSRLVVNAMEPRAAVGTYEDNRFILYAPSQGVVGMRANIADAMAVDLKNVRIMTGQVGGSFGMKAMVFPEYVCVLHAARELGRPVKWTDERSGSFVSDGHGRATDVTAELALDADGTFLAVRLTSFADMGAFLTPFGPFMATANAV
ncbi:MAG TPA: molybdopterin cofactor-binding domain-containing protein, partial [Xanthobacteraceae bacterium]|nr:molybdopterin cofactor-binding domain-containing protein [Xanthobacteraceae bacterium]